MKPSNYEIAWTRQLAGSVAVIASGVMGTLAWKTPTSVATTGNVTIATGLAAGQVIDGQTLAAGDRVLVWQNTLAKENGVYDVPTSGAASRSADFDSSAEIVGAYVPIEAGDTYGGKLFHNTNTGPVVVDTDAITFVLVSAPSSLGSIPDVSAASPVDGDSLEWNAITAKWEAHSLGQHAHVVGEPFVGDASQTVFYLANEAEPDTVAAYDVNGARVAITQDTTETDKITFTSAPAAGQGWLDYIPATS